VPPRIAVVGRHRPYPGGPLPEEPFISAGLRALGAAVSEIDVHGVSDAEALDRIQRFSSDVLIATHATVERSIEWWEALSKLRQHRHLVLWTPDVILLPGREEQYADRARFCDLLLHPANLGLKEIPNAHYFCAAATPVEGVKEAVDWSTRRYDLTCAFIGTPYPGVRQRLVERLRKAFGRKFQAFSPALGNGLYGTDLARVCSRTKVVIGCNVTDEVNGYWSDRMYQIPAHGGFLLATAPPGIAAHLTPGVHFAPLEDVEDAVAHVRHWARNPVPREQIRVEGFRHVHTTHTWAQRSKEMFRLLNAKGLIGERDFGVQFRVVVPVYNSRSWIGKCLKSIQEQTVGSFRCVVIDDNSSDDTFYAAQEAVAGDDRFTVVRNPQRSGALANIIRGIEMTNPEPSDVIVTVDGDDWLAHPRVFERLAHSYADKRCQLTYGQFWQVNRKETGWCVDYPAEVKRRRSFRHFNWIATHLRTFRYRLWRRIHRKDLLDPETGKPWEMSWDVAMMVPMLEMCGPNEFQFIPEVLYCYNDGNPLNDHKVDRSKQIDMHRRILELPSYVPAELQPT
jgi:hypothetical protein